MGQLLILAKKKNNDIAKIAMLARTYGVLNTDFFEIEGKSKKDLSTFIINGSWDVIFYDADYFLEQVNLYNEDIPSYLREQVTKTNPYIVSFSHIEQKALANPSADNYLFFPLNPSILGSVLRRAFDKVIKVLIVEDSSTQRLILKSYVQEKGYDVLEAEDGKKAITIIEKQCPDIIISDIEMPEMDGYQLANHLARDKKFNRIPILMVSALSNPNAIKKALSQGAIDYLTKPYDIEEINQKIIHYTNRFSKNRKTILVVDDSPLITKLITMTLQKERYKVINAFNGKEGLEKALSLQPDIITTDYNMPEMDGWEFCRKLKEQKETKNIPIIMITSKSTDLDKKIGRALKVYDYIPKPFTTEVLINTINTALIEQLSEQIKKEKETLNQEMKVGQQVQNHILSNIHIIKDKITAKSGWIPCKELSGDFYDLIECNDGSHLAIIGDVSGKGLPASLVTVASQACLRGQTLHQQNTGTLLDGLNKYLCIATNDEMFLTCFISHINSKEKILSYSSAGHNEMILYKKSTNEIISLSAKGLPCGMFELCEYQTKQIHYESGDILILYTDGVTEAEYELTQYGIEKLYDTIKENGQKCNAIELNQKIMDSVKKFVNKFPQSDDITLLLCDLY